MLSDSEELCGTYLRGKGLNAHVTEVNNEIFKANGTTFASPFINGDAIAGIITIAGSSLLKESVRRVLEVRGQGDKYSGRLPIPGTRSLVFNQSSKSTITNAVAAGVLQLHASSTSKAVPHYTRTDHMQQISFTMVRN